MITQNNFLTFIMRYSSFIGILLIILSLTGIVAFFHFSQPASPSSVVYAVNSASSSFIIPMHDSSGCPNSTVASSDPTPPDVMILPAQASTTITTHTGDMIEVRLPFGMQWSGPMTSQGPLEIQPPAGYPSLTNSACIWRFLAKGAGTTSLIFSSRALCLSGQACPKYMMKMPFTIAVK